MIRQLNFLIIILLTIFTCHITLAAPLKKSESLDRIAAVVNDTVITESELNTAINQIKKQMRGGNVSYPPKDILRKQVLDQLINKKLEIQLADQAGIHVTDVEIDKAVGNIAKANKFSVKELYEKVESQGMTKKEYRAEIHDEMLFQQIQQQAVGAKLTISPQEVDDFMRSKTWQAYNTKEYHLEDILVSLPEAPSPQDVAAAKKRADEILAKIHRGTSFSDIAAAESGNNNALQGGDLGWRKLPEIPPLFSNELIHMKPNDILGPLQTPNGFHIVRLVGVRTVAMKMTPQEQRKQVEQLIYQRKLEEATQSWMTKLRSEAFINLHPEN